jgi:hypothetical protein
LLHKNFKNAPKKSTNFLTSSKKHANFFVEIQFPIQATFSDQKNSILTSKALKINKPKTPQIHVNPKIAQKPTIKTPEQAIY